MKSLGLALGNRKVCQYGKPPETPCAVEMRDLKPTPMPWPIRIQLLLPTLSVVVLAIVLASGASAYLGAVRARQTQEENLGRVVGTMTEARFPLSEPVLRQMSGLSGAEFVFLHEDDHVVAGTLPLGDRNIAGSATSIAMTLRRRRPIGESSWADWPISAVACLSAPADDGPGRIARGALFGGRWSAAMRQAAYPGWRPAQSPRSWSSWCHRFLPSGSSGRSGSWAIRRPPSPGAISRPSAWHAATTKSGTWPHRSIA